MAKPFFILFLAIIFLAPPAMAETGGRNVEKINIGKKSALYPSLVTVAGAMVDAKPNWMVVAHAGMIGHSHILVSMSHKHYTTKGVLADKKLSLNLVDRSMLPKADYAGSVSGAEEDKSKLFAWRAGENGSPIIDEAPVSMELDVVDVYELEGFDNFICAIANTYAREDILDAKGKLDYNVLKPVLFEFPTYSYMATGEMLGKCRAIGQAPGMCAKNPMEADGVTRLAKIEVFPDSLEEYKKLAAEVGEKSLREEPGVLTMYAVADKDNPCLITILETYSSQAAYKAHIESPHFQKYKRESQKMVKSLILSDQHPVNPANRLTNFIIPE